MNDVKLTGTVVRDFALNKSGKVAYGTIAVNPVYGEIGWSKNRDEIKANFIPLRFIGERNADNAAKYLLKGTRILVKGNMIYVSNKDDSGNYHNDAYVIVNGYEFIGGKKESAPSGSNPEGTTDADGFMHIPEGGADEVPFS